MITFGILYFFTKTNSSMKNAMMLALCTALICSALAPPGQGVFTANAQTVYQEAESLQPENAFTFTAKGEVDYRYELTEATAITAPIVRAGITAGFENLSADASGQHPDVIRGVTCSRSTCHNHPETPFDYGPAGSEINI